MGRGPAGEGSSNADEVLLAALRGALTADLTPPPAVLAAAKQTWTWRTIDTELAAVPGDRADGMLRLIGDEPAGAGRRKLVFEAPGLVLHLHLHTSREGVWLGGRVEPFRPGEVVVDHPGGWWQAAVDEAGRFAVGPLPGGPWRVRFREAAGRHVETGWWSVSS